MVEYLSKSDVVALGIREMIERGELVPGELLRQRDLAERFNVSQTPVREALRRLQAEGFVVNELHHGSTVVRTHEARLYENYLIRASLESLAAGLAAERATERDIDEIAELLKAVDEAEDPVEHTARNRAFHFRIYEASDSPTLLALLRLLWRSLDAAPGAARHHDESTAQHHAILDALSRHDAETASRITREHIMGYANHAATPQGAKARAKARAKATTKPKV